MITGLSEVGKALRQAPAAGDYMETDSARAGEAAAELRVETVDSGRLQSALGILWMMIFLLLTLCMRRGKQFDWKLRRSPGYWKHLPVSCWLRVVT